MNTCHSSSYLSLCSRRTRPDTELCETALIHVQNNILRAMDQGKVGILLLLDMSAAFETVDHRTLLDRLHTELGIGGTALDWFESFLVGRHQVVSIRGEHSDSCLLRYGANLPSLPVCRVVYPFFTTSTRLPVFFNFYPFWEFRFQKKKKNCFCP